MRPGTFDIAIVTLLFNFRKIKRGVGNNIDL
jgi:hypothetical protein